MYLIVFPVKYIFTKIIYTISLTSYHPPHGAQNPTDFGRLGRVRVGRYRRTDGTSPAKGQNMAPNPLSCPAPDLSPQPVLALGRFCFIPRPPALQAPAKSR
jgi:hypothetical protein